MPIQSAINDLWEVRLNGEIDGQKTTNVLHFKTIGASGDVENKLITAVVLCFVQNVLPVLVAKWIFKETVWKCVGPTLGVEHISPAAANSVGGIAGDALPSFCAGLISLRTDLGGRSHRGRMYIAGIPESATDVNIIKGVDPLWGGLLAFCNCMMSQFKHPDPAGGSDLWNIGVYSRKLGGAKFPYTNAGFTSVTSMVPSADLATMRSRKKGHGA